MHGASFESPAPEAIAVYLEKGMTTLISLVISNQMDPIYIHRAYLLGILKTLNDVHGLFLEG